MNDTEKIEHIKEIIKQYANLPGGMNDLQEGIFAVLTIANINKIVNG